MQSCFDCILISCNYVLIVFWYHAIMCTFYFWNRSNRRTIKTENNQFILRQQKYFGFKRKLSLNKNVDDFWILKFTIIIIQNTVLYSFIIIFDQHNPASLLIIKSFCPCWVKTDQLSIFKGFVFVRVHPPQYFIRLQKWAWCPPATVGGAAVRQESPPFILSRKLSLSWR